MLYGVVRIRINASTCVYDRKRGLIEPPKPPHPRLRACKIPTNPYIWKLWCTIVYYCWLSSIYLVPPYAYTVYYNNIMFLQTLPTELSAHDNTNFFYPSGSAKPSPFLINHFFLHAKLISFRCPIPLKNELICIHSVGTVSQCSLGYGA